MYKSTRVGCADYDILNLQAVGNIVVEIQQPGIACCQLETPSQLSCHMTTSASPRKPGFNASSSTAHARTTRSQLNLFLRQPAARFRKGTCAPTPPSPAAGAGPRATHKTGTRIANGRARPTDLHVGVEVRLAPGCAGVVRGEHVGLGRWEFANKGKQK